MNHVVPVDYPNINFADSQKCQIHSEVPFSRAKNFLNSEVGLSLSVMTVERGYRFVVSLGMIWLRRLI